MPPFRVVVARYTIEDFRVGILKGIKNPVLQELALQPAEKGRCEGVVVAIALAFSSYFKPSYRVICPSCSASKTPLMPSLNFRFCYNSVFQISLWLPPPEIRLCRMVSNWEMASTSQQGLGEQPQGSTGSAQDCSLEVDRQRSITTPWLVQVGTAFE